MTAKKIEITTDILSDSFLKFCGAALRRAGKEMVKSGAVKVNNEICFQRGRKLKAGDEILIGNRRCGMWLRRKLNGRKGKALIIDCSNEFAVFATLKPE